MFMRIKLISDGYTFVFLKQLYMRKLLSGITLSLLLLTAASFTKTNPPAETATIYVYRVGQFGAAAANWAVFADGEKICKLSNNKFIKHEVQPGKHIYTAKVGGVGLLKKETELEIEAEAGKSYYVACNVKSSVTRTRMELIEVTKGTGEKQMAGMTLDNCQEKIDGTSEN